MDFYAHSQIEELDAIAKENGIEVPRLRGYRLMKNETVVTKQDIEELEQLNEVRCIEALCESVPFWDMNSCIGCSDDPHVEKRKNKYLVKDSDGIYVSVNWSQIHGWKRKVAKRYIKQTAPLIQKQYSVWNKYVGREDVLYIHARIGGNNWKDYEDVAKRPWFLDRSDDWFDTTYCDIYAKIK